MSKRNRYGNKKGSSSPEDIINSLITRGRLKEGRKTEQINIRVTPRILAWLRKQGNMSKYIIGLIVDDMVNRGD